MRKKLIIESHNIYLLELKNKMIHLHNERVYSLMEYRNVGLSSTEPNNSACLHLDLYMKPFDLVMIYIANKTTSTTFFATSLTINFFHLTSRLTFHSSF